MPTQVVLDGKGQMQEGRGGPEYRYFLDGEKIMWVPPEVHGQIEEAGAAGRIDGATPITITKEQSKRGAPVRWRVEVGPAIAQRPHTAGPRPDGKPYPNPTAAGRAPQPAAQLAANAPELPVTHADLMAQCIKDAIDLLRGAKSYAPEIVWDTQDVRCLAASLFIAQTGGRK
jgi:hypothetical protein